MLKREDVILFSGGAQGAEEAFGACAESFGVEEVNFSFDGHKPVRTRGLRVLNHEELAAGEVSLAYVSRLMSRRYPDTPTFRKILQSIWYQINHGQEIFNDAVNDTFTASISGQTLVFAANHPAHLHLQFSGRRNLRKLHLYADKVIIRSPLLLPQTHVTIHARELRFENASEWFSALP